ncbi:hypothetical protein PG993_007950 [Apiospora rasikravindrae]|uniref:Uncharacterized protein n=1 Tax=Apiospora rasikravindrae TaxID=990691 RepID=A0ABR1SYY9_9PEZI
MSFVTTYVGALTTQFTPIPGCNSVYIQDNSKGESFLKYGTVGPAQISSCFPSNYALVGWYSPGICPSGYWYACEAELDKSTTVATCCPENYSCKINRPSYEHHQCESGFTKATSTSLSHCYTRSGTPVLPCEKFRSTSYNPGDAVRAYGINVRRESGDLVWSGIPDPTGTESGGSSSSDAAATAQPPGTTVSPEEGGGLSSGAKIGIGVGVSLGALLIIGAVTAAYLIGKRSRRKREEGDKEVKEEQDETRQQQAAKIEQEYERVHSADAAYALQQEGTGRQELFHAQQPAELSSERPPAEMGHRFF